MCRVFSLLVLVAFNFLVDDGCKTHKNPYDSLERCKKRRKLNYFVDVFFFVTVYGFLKDIKVGFDFDWYTGIRY